MKTMLQVLAMSTTVGAGGLAYLLPTSFTTNVDRTQPLRAPISAVAAAPLPLDDSDEEPPRFDVSVISVSDLYDEVPDANVRILHGSGAVDDLATDAEGQTEFVPAIEGEPLTVLLGETQLALGIALGQMRHTTMTTSPDSVDATFLTFEASQPLAYPFVWGVDDPMARVSVEASPYHDRWTIDNVLGGPQVAFSGHVAPLLIARDIQGFAGYNDVQFGVDGDDYRVGVVIRTGNVRLPTGSIMLTIDCRGHGFTSAPAATCFILRYTDTSLPSPSLVANVVDFLDERAYIAVSGDLEEGDNVILLVPGPYGAATERLQANPPVFGDGAGTDGGSNCVPTSNPPANWTCDPEDKKSSAGCDKEQLLATNCKISSQKAGPIECSSGGSREVKTEYQRSVSVSVTVGDVEVTGEFSETVSSTSTENFGAGAHGCGECKRPFKHRLVCAEKWWYEIGHWWYHQGERDWFCRQCTGTSKCTDELNDVASCSRTCN